MSSVSIYGGISESFRHVDIKMNAGDLLYTQFTHGVWPWYSSLWCRFFNTQICRAQWNLVLVLTALVSWMVSMYILSRRQYEDPIISEFWALIPNGRFKLCQLGYFPSLAMTYAHLYDEYRIHRFEVSLSFEANQKFIDPLQGLRSSSKKMYWVKRRSCDQKGLSLENSSRMRCFNLMTICRWFRNSTVGYYQTTPTLIHC